MSTTGPPPPRAAAVPGLVDEDLAVRVRGGGVRGVRDRGARGRVVAEVVVLVGVVADELALVDHQVRLPEGIHLLVCVRLGDVLADRARAAALPAARRDDACDLPRHAVVGAGVQGERHVAAVAVVGRRPVRVGGLVLLVVGVVARHDAREEQRARLEAADVLREHVEERVSPVALVLRVLGIAGEVRRSLDLRQLLPGRSVVVALVDREGLAVGGSRRGHHRGLLERRDEPSARQLRRLGVDRAVAPPLQARFVAQLVEDAARGVVRLRTGHGYGHHRGCRDEGSQRLSQLSSVHSPSFGDDMVMPAGTRPRPSVRLRW